jgi:hypothetical protein
VRPSEIFLPLLGCHQELLLENSGRRRTLGLIPISFNINNSWVAKILMKNGKLLPFFDPKWDKISNIKRRIEKFCLIEFNLVHVT